MESQLVSEFMSKTGSTQSDAKSCLETWGWDLKRAITDYNDTYPNTEENDTINNEEIQQNKDLCHPTSVKMRPLLVKSDSIDIVDYRKLSRGISRATDNINLVSRARTEIAMDFHGLSDKNIEQPSSLDTPDCTFILPNIFNYPAPFRTFLEKDLIECSTLNALEQTQRLNWWTENGACRKLWPLATTGDGNCLLHAASLGMWGFHDRKLTLRTALFSLLSTGKYRDALCRRWRFQQTRFNKKAGFVYSDVEWTREWNEIVTMASPEPRNSNYTQKDSRRRMSCSDKSKLPSVDSIDDSATYESLEEIHILALAHILRRTIIVISDTVLRDSNGEAMAPIPFGGVYLPFEITSSECNRGPLLLAYDMAHFSALVPMESENDLPPTLIPLVDSENVLLPIQFCIDPGEDFDWKNYDGNEGNWALTDREHIALLKEYLDIVYAGNSGSPDEEVYEDLTDEEIEKKFVDSEMVMSSSQHPDELLSSKSKAAKQLQSVAKQFGSIGKSMSKKIKKNIGSITKIGGKNLQKKSNLSSGSSTQSFTYTRMLCARLRVKRHEFQEAMIRNYLECAHGRFLESDKSKDKRDYSQGIEDGQNSYLYCVNSGCKNFASSDTCYLCYECYEKQRQCESASYMNTAPRYGTGKSKFYAQADINSHDSIKQLPPVRRLNELDQTLYLSNSTFFNDNLPAYNEIGIPNRETLYRHGYSPTVKINDEIDGSFNSGTVSVFSPGNTINKTTSTITSLVPSNNAGRFGENDNEYHVETTVDRPATSISTPIIQLQAKACRTPGCVFYGSANTNFYCSKCCQNRNEIAFCSTLTNDTPTGSIYPTAAIPKTGSKIMSDI